MCSLKALDGVKSTDDLKAIMRGEVRVGRVKKVCSVVVVEFQSVG